MSETIVITGASDGIGAEAARQLNGHGHRLILVGRSPEKTQTLAEELGAEHLVADFTRLDEVRDLAASLLAACGRIDVLANNAGGIFSGPELTEDGFEKTFQVNHLAPFLLTHLLEGRLLASEARVVNTSSIGARLLSRLDLQDPQSLQGFRMIRAYGNAKLANILFTKGLHQRCDSQGLSTVSFHPGIVATNLGADTRGWFRWAYHTRARGLLTPVQEGGRTLAHFITGVPGCTWLPGAYHHRIHGLGRTHRAVEDPQVVRRHWDLSEELLGLEPSWPDAEAHRELSTSRRGFGPALDADSGLAQQAEHRGDEG